MGRGIPCSGPALAPCTPPTESQGWITSLLPCILQKSPKSRVAAPRRRQRTSGLWRRARTPKVHGWTGLGVAGQGFPLPGVGITSCPVPPGPSKGKELEEEWAPTEKISEWEPGRGGGVQSPFLLCNFCPGVRGVPGVQGSYIK